MDYKNETKLINLILLALVNHVSLETVKKLDGKGLNLTRDGQSIGDAVISHQITARMQQQLTQ